MRILHIFFLSSKTIFSTNLWNTLFAPRLFHRASIHTDIISAISAICDLLPLTFSEDTPYHNFFSHLNMNTSKITPHGSNDYPYILEDRPSYLQDGEYIEVLSPRVQVIRNNRSYTAEEAREIIRSFLPRFHELIRVLQS